MCDLVQRELQFKIYWELQFRVYWLFCIVHFSLFYGSSFVGHYLCCFVEVRVQGSEPGSPRRMTAMRAGRRVRPGEMFRGYDLGFLAFLHHLYYYFVSLISIAVRGK